jgi:hypothetical protein
MASLILYATQQLGIVLAVGGQTIVLVAYLLAMRDRVVDSTEAQFARAVRTVLVAGLFLIILSGVGVSAMHYFAGELYILLSPAYLFKWILLGAVLLFTLGIGTNLLPQWLGEALAGGTWYALFFLHILAPDTNWESLLILYGGWLGAFALFWLALVFGTRERAGTSSVPKSAQPAAAKPVPPKSQPIPDIPSVKIETTAQPPLRPLPGQHLPVPTAAKPPVPPPPPPLGRSPATGEAKPVPPSPAPIKPPAPMEVPLMQPKPLPPVGVPATAPAPVHIPMQKPAEKPMVPAVPPSTSLGQVGTPAPTSLAAAHSTPDLPAIRVMPKGPPTV